MLCPYCAGHRRPCGACHGRRFIAGPCTSELEQERQELALRLLARIPELERLGEEQRARWNRSRRWLEERRRWDD